MENEPQQTGSGNSCGGTEYTVNADSYSEIITVKDTASHPPGDSTPRVKHSAAHAGNVWEQRWAFLWAPMRCDKNAGNAAAKSIREKGGILAALQRLHPIRQIPHGPQIQRPFKGQCLEMARDIKAPGQHK